MANEQLTELSLPFPQKYIKENPSGGGVYVPHAIIKQRLLLVLGNYNLEVKEIIRGDVDAVAPNPNGTSKKAKAGSPARANVIVGAVCKLSAEIDGRYVSVEDVGDCENPQNWPHDGARLKDAISDCLKRCAANLGLGLHLWCKTPAEYFLYQKLSKTEDTDELVEK